MLLILREGFLLGLDATAVNGKEFCATTARVMLQRWTFGILIHLQYDLSGNSFQLPKFNGLLENLRYLNLSSALSSEGAEIPEFIGNLSSLETLDLSNNYFEENPIPKSFGQLKSLNYLNISNSGFGGEIPPNLGNLSNLNHLDLGGNFFLKISSERLNWLPRLSSLTYLNLDFLNLRSAGASWLSVVNILPSLLELHLFECAIERIPLSIQKVNMTSLLVLDMSMNSIISPLPSWFSNLTSLRNLYLSGDYFNGNYFTGPIPREFASLEYLQGLDFSGNRLEDSVLESLDLSSNELEDELPDSLGMLHNLQYVNLEFNNFSGKIPESIGKLSSLKTLNLSYNNMIGPIPDSLGQLPELVHLDLSRNSWEGILTESHFANLTKLRSIDVSTYRPMSLIVNLTYEWIPPFKLYTVGITNCNVGPNFPAWLLLQTELSDVTLRSTGISGIIPEEWFLKILSQLKYLDLSYNHISGRLPLQLKCPKLYHIDLSYNRFDGPLPLLSANVTIFNLESNSFSGPVPLNIDQLMLTLQGLYLSDNQLKGTIPPSICNLQSLSILSLRNNQLFGEFPQEWSMWPLMLIVDVGYNNLSGQIPQSLSSLTSLSYLNLSYNNLGGRIPSGNQLQTLEDPSIYEGNLLLCGVPLSTKCPGDDTFTATDAKDSNEDGNDKLWFYVSMALGFTVGFWGVCGTLLVKKSWRYAYFRLFDDIKDKVMLAIAVKAAHFQRKL
nr:receptor-like protein EIX1 [Malus domestica]